MKQSAMQRLDQVGRDAVPIALTLVLMMVTAVPLRLPPFDTVEPGLVLICVYFWAIHRPELMPQVAVFLIGIAQDMVTGTPLGLNTFTLLVIYGAVSSQRVFFLGRPFIATWLGFLLVSAAYALIIWLLACLLRAALIDPGPVFLQFLMTLFLYPPMAWVLAMVQRTALRQVD